MGNERKYVIVVSVTFRYIIKNNFFYLNEGSHFWSIGTTLCPNLSNSALYKKEGVVLYEMRDSLYTLIVWRNYLQYYHHPSYLPKVVGQFGLLHLLPSLQ